MSESVFVCRHIRNKIRDVMLVVHHSDGMWQITCGKFDHPSGFADLFQAEDDDLEYISNQLPSDLKFVRRGWMADKQDGVWVQLAHDD